MVHFQAAIAPEQMASEPHTKFPGSFHHPWVAQSKRILRASSNNRSRTQSLECPVGLSFSKAYKISKRNRHSFCPAKIIGQQSRALPNKRCHRDAISIERAAWAGRKQRAADRTSHEAIPIYLEFDGCQRRLVGFIPYRKKDGDVPILLYERGGIAGMT
ncbi:hypothetical protein D3C87_1626460 [compost metagenome]